MTSVEKRRSGRKSGGHRKHSDGGYSDTSSAGSFLDETDREVSNLTDRAFRSLCIGDEAVYNDSDLCSSSPCSQRDRQLAFSHSGQDRDREDREREELKRAAHESFSLRVQQYGQDWIHGGMYGAEIQRDPQWEVYGERTQGRVSATFQHSFVETSQQEDSLRQEQLSFHSNGATELSLQQRRSRSRVSSLIRAFNSEGHRDGAVMDGKLKEWNDETSWDKSALMSIQKELSEFSTSYQQNFNSGHFPTAGPFSSQDANFYSSEVAAVAHMNSASSFMRSSHSKHSMSAQVNCNSNFFIHSEFSPFKVWRDHNRFPFQQGEVSGFMHRSEFPKWYETPMYKELSLGAQPQGPYRFEERGIRHPRNNLAPVVPPTPSRSTSTSTMLQKALPVEKRCESELAGHYPHRKRAQSLGTNRLPSQRPSTASPTIEMSRRVQDTISSVKALQQKIKMMTEQNITTSMAVNQQEVLYGNDNLIPNYANTVASNVVSNNTSTTPFNISQLLTPSVHTHQEIETSEIHQYAVSPQPVEHPPVRAESRGATPDVRMSSYKSRATSLLFNLKDNRKRVKSTYSPPKFKGLETQERNKQPPIQEPRDTVIDIPDFPDQDIQYHQAEEASRTNAASHQYVNQYHNPGLILNSQPATAHTGQYSEYTSGDYQAAQMQGGMVHHSGFTGFLPENYAGNQLANGQNLYEDLSSFTPYKQGMIDNVETLGEDVYRYKPSFSATGAPGLNADNQTRQYLISKANTEQHFNETVGGEFTKVDRYQQLSDNKHDYSNVSSQDRWRQTNSQDTENLSLKTAVSPWKQEITALIEKDQHAEAYQRAAVIKEELTLPRDKYRGENQQIINKEAEKIELRESFAVGTSSHKQTGWVNPNISNQLPQHAQFSNDAVENPACYGQQQPGAFKDKYVFQKYYGHYKENETKDNYLMQNNNRYSDQEYRNQHSIYSNDMLTQETGQRKPMPKGQEMQSLQPIEAKPQFEPNMQKNSFSNPDNASAPTLEKRVEQRQFVEVKAEQAMADHVKAQHAQAELAKAQHWAQVEQPKVESAGLILAGQTGSEKVKAEQARVELTELESVNQVKDEHIVDKGKEEQTRAEQTRVRKGTEEAENITEEAGAKYMREVQGQQVKAEQAEAERLKEEHIKTELVKTEQAGQAETEQARRERVTAEQLEEERTRTEQVERERVEQIRTEKVKAEQAESELREAEQAQLEQIKEQQAKVEQAKLEQIKEQQAKAEQAKLEQIKKQQAKAEQARLEQIKEQQAKAEQARLEQIKEQQAKAEQAKLEQIKEQQAKAEQARLEQIKEQRAKAEQARLEQIKEQQAKLEQQAKAEQARLEHIKEQQAKAEQARLEQIKEQQAKLEQQAKAEQARLEQIKEQQAKAEQARLEQIKEQQAKLEQQAKAEQARLEQIKEQQAKAEQARLEQIKVQRAKAEQARLEQTKEQQAKAEQVRLEQTKEQQAKAGQARLEQIKEQQAKAEQARLEQIKEQQAKEEQAKLEQLKQQQAKAKEENTKVFDTDSVQAGQGTAEQPTAQIHKTKEGKVDRKAELAKSEQNKVELPEAELTKEKLTKPTAKLTLTQQVKSEPDKVEQVKTELAKAKAELAKIKEKMRGEQKEKVRSTVLAKEDGVKKDEPLRVNITKNEEYKDQEQATQMHQQREDSVVIKSQSTDPARGITEYERLREKYGFTDTDSTDRNKLSTAENISSNYANETSALPPDKVKTTYNETSKDKYSPTSIFATSNTEIRDEVDLFKSSDVTESQYVYSESSKEFKLSGADYLPSNGDRTNSGTAADKVKDGTFEKLEKCDPVKHIDISQKHIDVSQQRDSDFVKPLPLERKLRSNETSVGPGKDQHFTPPRALSHKERAQTKQEILTSKIKAHAEKEISAIKEKGFAIRDGFISKTSAKQLAGIQNINIRQRPPSQEVSKKHESTMSSNTTPKHQMEPSGKQMEPVKSVSSPVKSAMTTSQLVDHLKKQVPKEPMKSNDNFSKPPKEAKQTGSYTMSTNESLSESAKKENQSGVKTPMPSKEQAPKNKQAKQESNHGEISGKQKEGLKDNPVVNIDHLNKKTDDQAPTRVKPMKTEKEESQQEAVHEDSAASLKLVFGQNENPVVDDSLQITGIMVTVRERKPSVNSTQDQINAKEKECGNLDKRHLGSDLEVSNRNKSSKEAGKVEVKDKGVLQNTHATLMKEDVNKVGINNHPENVQETSTLETRQNNVSENVSVKMMSSSANAGPQRETQVQESLTEKDVSSTATVPAKNKAETQPPLYKQGMIARETKDYTNKMPKENSAKSTGNDDVKSHTRAKNTENMQTAHTNENFMAKMVDAGINYTNDSNRVHAETVIKNDTHPSMKDDMTTAINPSESSSTDGKNTPLLESKRHDPTPPKPFNKTSPSDHFTENKNINAPAKHQYQDSHFRENNQEDDTDVHIGSIAIRVVPAVTEKDNLKMVGKNHGATVSSDVVAAREHKQVASASHEDKAKDFTPSNEKQMAESLDDKSGAQLSDSLKISIQQNTININSENTQDENGKPEKVKKYGKSVGGSKAQPMEGDYFQVVAGTNNELHSGANVGGDTSDAHSEGRELPGLLPNKSATSNKSYNEGKNEVFVLDQSKMKTMESSSVNVQEENMKRKSRETEYNLASKQSDGSSESNKSNKNEKTEAGQAIHIRKQHTENQSGFSARERQGSRNSHPPRENTVKEKPEVKTKPKERTSTIPEISAIADYARLKVIVSEDRETPIQEFPPNKKEGFFPLIQTRHSRRPVFTADPQDLSAKEKSLPNKTEVSSKVNKEPKPLVFPITEKEHLRTGMFKLGDKERPEKMVLDAKANDDVLDNGEEHAQHLREINKSPTTHLKNKGSEQQVAETDTQRVCQVDQSIDQSNNPLLQTISSSTVNRPRNTSVPKHLSLTDNSNLHTTLRQVNNTDKSKHTPLRKDEKIENALAKTGEERPEKLKQEKLASHHEETTARQGRAKQLEEEQVEKRAEDMKIKHMIEESRASLAEEERRAAQREEERRAREREAIAIKIKEKREKQREAERRTEEERKARQTEEEMRAKQREEDRRMKESEEKRRIKIEEERRAKLREEEERIRESERRAAQEQEQRRAAQEEEQRRRVAQEEEQRRRVAQEEQRRKAAQEKQQRRAAQEEEQQRRAAQEVEQRRRAAQEEQQRKAAQEEEQRRRAAQEEEQRRRVAQEEQRRKAAQEEQQWRAAQEEEQRRRAAQEAEQRRRAAQEEQQRKAAQKEEQQQRRAAQEEQQRKTAQEEEQQQRRAAQEEQQRKAAQEEQQRRAAHEEEQRRRAAQEEEQRRRAALIEEQRRAKQIEEKILKDIEDEKKRKQREEENRKAEHQAEEQRSERQKREELMRTQREQEEKRAVQKEKTTTKQREEKQAKEDRTILVETKQAALKGEEKRVAQEQVLSQREDEIMAKKRGEEEEKLAAYREKERVALMEEQKRAAQKMDALQYYAFTSTESERKPRERQLSSPLPSKRHNPTGLESPEDSHTRPYRPHAPASPAPSLPRSTTSSPAFGVKPSMFRVKDNTNRGSSLTKSVKPRFHKNFGEDFRVGSPMGSERGEEEQETMRRSIDSGLNRLASIKESSTFRPGSSSQDYSAPLPHYRPYSRRSIALDEDDSRSVISNMSEDVESFATSAADLADIRGLYDYERPESACSFSSDVSRLGKPPVVPPKSEKALRRAKRLTTRRIKKELSKAVADSPAGTENPLQEVSSAPSPSSTEVRSSNHHAVASPHFSPPVSLAHTPTLGSSLPSSHTEQQSSHSSFYASPHATGPISLPAASPHATPPVSIPVASPHATGPASHPAAPKTVADVPSSPTLHHAKHPAPVTQYHVESSYPQSYPLTQRKVLQDLGSGQYFVVDVPVQVKTKTFFDPETGKYVQLNVRESSQSASRPQPQQPYLQPQLTPQIHGKPQQQPLSQDSPAGKPLGLYQGYHGYPQGYQPAAMKRSAPVTLHQNQQPVSESHSYGYPAPEMGQNSEGHRYSPEKTPYMDTVNDTDKTYNTVYNTHGPYESFPQCDTNSQLAGSSVCENDNSAHSRYQPRDIITMSELEDFMELSDW